MQNILIYGHYLSKWEDSANENFEICNTVHNIPHLLFDCDLAKYIWKKLKTLLIMSLINMKLLYYMNPEI